ncbi:N-acyl amino acid synthase FeeM domain-containing protein [Aromatoleum petrolei]|uniref:Long-chain N-acyl amino acid synthase n=1 Tax=Aromatoleum petrolei TaxID=76116 RepID=A0ABX1MHI6_9RHOO|nr:long-chain N-acyl amino acid synthase [Aromatoleum petrolei]NMF87395.1 long-chain N-acyl amino acid synthase [Aromatoleum petrolei]QTQ35762.1 Acyl-CoA N-acyltransferase domain-containing protein [Aromatoleum petrolei]
MNSAASIHEARQQSVRSPSGATHTRRAFRGEILHHDFALRRNGYHLRIVPPHGPLRADVDRLIHRMYSWRGLTPYQGHDSAGQPIQTTLVACKGDRPFGTLTVGMDLGKGLLADTLYRTEIDSTRSRGGQVCEVTRLAMDPEHSTPETMAAIFHLGFIIARLVHGMTDSYIEVHPRHTSYYRRTLGYRVAGPHLTCPRVGAPAVLMHLPLSHAEQQALRYGGSARTHSRNLYQLFLSPSEQRTVLDSLHRPYAG